MATVVFLRGANVGGRRKFRPAALAKELADLDVVNIGTAGTFVVRGAATQAAIRAAIVGRLPFETQLMIRPAREIVALLRSNPFEGSRQSKDLRYFVSVLDKSPKQLPRLPLERPSGGQWQVRVIAVLGRYALSLWRRREQRLIYPNEVVEKHLVGCATTRGWDTIQKIHDALQRG